MNFTFRDFVKSLPVYKSWHDQLELMRLESMKHSALDSLDLLHAIFEDNSIKYWLYAGTLLGFIRDGGPITGDPDIDLGFRVEDILLIEKAVVDKGFVKIHEFSFNGIIYEERYEYNGVGIDFFYFSKDSNVEYTYQFNRKVTSFYPVKEEHYDNEFSNIIKFNFSGHVYNIPSKYERILENTYGEWRVPLSRENGYQMFSAPIHKHLRSEVAKYESFSKSVHQLNIFSFISRCILNKLKK